jgi:formylglycine-generating enzyme required for sulfatase activity
MFGKAIVRGFSAVAMVCCAVVAEAATVNIDTVWVTNPGNANDSTGYGGVSYVYQMGKYEVTNAQYREFLTNKAVTDTYGLYNTSMSSDARGGIARSGGEGSYSYAVKSGYENMPVTFVCWYDTIRFANWLQNGQGSGGTESGTYDITSGGPNSGTVAIPTAETRATWTAATKHWVLPSENEWYKAAYHQPTAQSGDPDNYWAYPTPTNTEPHSDNPASLDYPTNSANFYRDDSTANGYDDGHAVTGLTSYVSTQNYLTDVGAYAQSGSFYGTFDQGGNVWEWDEALIGSSSRGLRGGGWGNYSDSFAASYRFSIDPTNESLGVGFRVASVPEPGSLAMLLGIALTALLYWWRRRA